MKKALRVLVVEDSTDDAKLLVRELERGGYEVSYEQVARAARLCAALHSGPWDIVFCDFTMPHFSGPKALQIVRDHDLNLPFIYVSGTIDEEAAVEAMANGAQDCVTKNNLKRLLPAVEREICTSELRRQRWQLDTDRARLIEDLLKALAASKRHGGLSLLCTECGRVQTEQREWQAVEDFIRDHSEVQVSHGLCPSCAHRAAEQPFREDRLRD